MPRSKEVYPVLAPLSRSYPELEGRLSTCYSPVRHSTSHPKVTFAFDLHVLSTPPAFVLSQDQTLQFDSFARPFKAKPAPEGTALPQSQASFYGHLAKPSRR